jgi:SAM-dependent methyltransferase
MMEDIRSFYDAIAEKTADDWYPNNILLPTIRDFLSLLPQKPRVLDLGCGPGYESLRWASAGAEAVGESTSVRKISESPAGAARNAGSPKRTSGIRMGGMGPLTACLRALRGSIWRPRNWPPSPDGWRMCCAEGANCSPWSRTAKGSGRKKWKRMEQSGDEPRSFIPKNPSPVR